MHRRRFLEILGGAAAAAVALPLYRGSPYEERYESELSRRYDAWWQLADRPPGDTDLLAEARELYREEKALYVSREEPVAGAGGIYYTFHLHPDYSLEPAASREIPREEVEEELEELEACSSETYAEDDLAVNIMEGDLP